MGIFSGALLDRLNNDRLNKKAYCNVKINVGGEIFYGHRFLLGASSGYFERLFEGQFEERFLDEIIITGSHGNEICGRAMELIIEYTYTENIALNDENIYDVMTAVDFLDIWQLKPICEEFLISSISSETWMKTFQTADHFSLKSVTETCIARFPEFFADLDLTNFDLSSLEMIMNKQSEVMKSSSVFDVIVSWINCKYDERKHHLDALIKYVDFKSMDIRFVKERVLTTKLISKRPDICEIPELNEICDHLELTHFDLKEFESILRVQQQRDKDKEVFEFILEWVRHDEVGRALHFDNLIKYVDFDCLDAAYIENKVLTLHMVTEHPQVIADISYVLANKMFVVVGGRENMLSVVKYSPHKKDFISCQKPSLSPCNYSAVASYKRKVYVAGGDDGIRNIQIMRNFQFVRTK